MSTLEASTVTTVGTVMVIYLCVLIFIGWRAALSNFTTHKSSQICRSNIASRGRNQDFSISL